MTSNQSVVTELERALAAHSRGDLAGAEKGYRAILRSRPTQFDALHMLGVLRYQQGRMAEANDCLTKALGVNASSADAHSNRGAVLLAMGRNEEALACFDTATKLRPSLASAHFNRGNVLRQFDRLEEAAQSYTRALDIDRKYADAYLNRGTVFHALARYPEALDDFARILELQPKATVAYLNRGVVFQAMGEHGAALAEYDRALALQPDYAEAHSNRGNALQELARFAEAAESHREAIALKPDFVDPHNNLANDLQKLGDPVGALASYRMAIKLAPDNARTHLNIALTLLTLGRWSEGWEEFEWRWSTPEFASSRRPFTETRWKGQLNLDGALLVWGEQSIGDEILFLSMIDDLVAAGVEILLEVEARLVPLAARTWQQAKVVARRTPPDASIAANALVAQIPTGSLGRFLRSDDARFPSRPAYLCADRERAAQYRRRLMGDARPGERLIGISWISKNFDIGHHKTVALTAWETILKTPNLRFVDLQYGETTEERAAAVQELGVPIEHLPDLDLFDDLDGLAALIAACDLVITVSNTTAHMAAALGVPVWVMVPAGAGKLWYWGCEGSMTPWYASATLFRQTMQSDWRETIASVAAQLAAAATPPHGSV